MSPAPLDEAIHRTNINLFLSDVRKLEAWYGRGWTEVVRNLVRDHVKEKEKVKYPMYRFNPDTGEMYEVKE